MIHRLPLSPRSSNSEYNFNNGFYKLLGSLGPLFSINSSRTCLHREYGRRQQFNVVNELSLWEGLLTLRGQRIGIIVLICSQV